MDAADRGDRVAQAYCGVSPVTESARIVEPGAVRAVLPVAFEDLARGCEMFPRPRDVVGIHTRLQCELDQLAHVSGERTVGGPLLIDFLVGQSVVDVELEDGIGHQGSPDRERGERK
ncbi:hypothetical protein [Rhodococcus pyridinivorans]|uniref:hypothetical protein n=1 Tax=Rhodococcus pyridinivorans TaxID=103816 RepID=UPI0027D88F54|nr:hypothetical protein [Rhodococcus pyridinivorans]